MVSDLNDGYSCGSLWFHYQIDYKRNYLDGLWAAGDSVPWIEPWLQVIFGQKLPSKNLFFLGI